MLAAREVERLGMLACDKCHRLGPRQGDFEEFMRLAWKERLVEGGRVYLCSGCAPGMRRRNKSMRCRHGHRYTQENSYYDRKGKRHCRRCISVSQKLYKKRHHEEIKQRRRNNKHKAEYNKRYYQQHREKAA